MHLKQLRITGFKSFADSHVVNFNRGLTAIVGPNGCGKSNIIDSIRWVLGEQRTKSLRSEKMEDVIFSGTIRRKPLNFCEVTLSIENDDNTLPIEYKTVAITRRMFRTGESEYMINKKLCRLKDIHALFYDTGMGIGSYSLMEQKQIDKVLSEKDEERRVMFEEAAGINKYRNQRKEALKNLLKTSEDLSRISDIVAEKDRTVKMLARHVEKAKKFREYKDELTQLDVGFCYKLFKELSGELREVSHNHSEMRVERERIEAQVSTSGAVVEEKELTAMRREEKLQESDKEISQIAEQIHRVENNITALRSRIEGAKNTMAQIELYQGKLDENIVNSREQFASLEQHVISLEAAVQEAEAVFLAARREIDEFEIEAAEKKLELNRSQQAKIKLMEEDGDLKSRLEKARSILDNLDENRRTIDNSISAERAHLTECEERVSICRNSLKSMDEEHSNLSSSRDSLVGRINDEELKYRAILEAEKTLEAHLISDEKKLEFFEDMARNHEGYKGAVSSVLKEGISGIKGIVADIIDVNPDHVTAVEAALGSRVQYILADSEEAAREAVRYLQDGKKGKAVFAVSGLMRERSRSAEMEKLSSLEGVFGWADSFVKCKKSDREIVSLLLGDVLLVKNADAAALVRENAGADIVHCVTPDGDTYSTSGIIRGGLTAGGEMGLISRTQLIDSLKKGIEKATTEIAVKKNEKVATIATLEEAKKALYGIDEKLQEGRRLKQSHEGDIRHLDEEIMRIRNRQKDALEQIAAIERRMEGLIEDEKIAETKLAELEERKTVNESSILLLSEEVRVLDDKRMQLIEKRRASELKFSQLQQELATAKREHNKIESDINKAFEEQVKGKDEREKFIADIETWNAEISHLEVLIEEGRLQRKLKEDEQVKYREGYAELRKEISDLRRNSGDIQKVQNEISEKVHACEMQMERLNEKKRSIQERIWEEYEKDLGSLTDEEAVLELPENEVREKIDILRKRLKAIGPNVNLSVLEDYETEKKVHDELSVQKIDLENAKNSLEKLVKTLDKEASEKFLETFNQVRENFRKVFITLFDGGEADIRLEDDPDPLNAKIVIYARPSGKSMKNISLLSGGERALTATSLLFGLYLVKSSPYCILDEVDGPLDDANIGRFINLIRSFSEKTQFLIITHNKKTMAACDILYGVTLIEPGVSRTVSVSLANQEDEKKVDAIMNSGVVA
ncbi:MAG: chromosome segregation protein SMC [Fibrobacteres bacterium]|nr:chromosome segregation protein SMC [Fibrobacterota bacterium]